MTFKIKQADFVEVEISFENRNMYRTKVEAVPALNGKHFESIHILCVCLFRPQSNVFLLLSCQEENEEARLDIG